MFKPLLPTLTWYAQSKRRRFEPWIRIKESNVDKINNFFFYFWDHSFNIYFLSKYFHHYSTRQSALLCMTLKCDFAICTLVSPINRILRVDLHLESSCAPYSIHIIFIKKWRLTFSVWSYTCIEMKNGIMAYLNNVWQIEFRKGVSWYSTLSIINKPISYILDKY